MQSIINIIDLSFRQILKAVLRIYRLTISPFLGNNCRFHPTCSQYALDALTKKTFLKALSLIIIRVLKCHPFHSGGYDPIK